MPIFLIASAFVNRSFLSNENIFEDNVEWLSFEEMTNKMASEPKMVFVSFCTDWNEWCKSMEANVFSNPQIIDALSGNFYAVKFDSQMKESVTYKDKVYELDETGRRPEHQLAQELATKNDRLGYPTIVILDKNMDKIKAFQGHKTVDRLKQVLDYYGNEDNYLKKTWIEYIQESGF